MSDVVLLFQAERVSADLRGIPYPSSGSDVTSSPSPREIATPPQRMWLVQALRAAADETEGVISIDPAYLHGAPRIAGTRIPVHRILFRLEAGYSIDDIVQDYPPITREQVRVAIRFAGLLLENSASEFVSASG
jgi:uncharacterized protein (DUF433 family)